MSSPSSTPPGDEQNRPAQRRRQQNSLPKHFQHVSLHPTASFTIPETTNDGLLLLEACLRGIYTHVSRRPHESERERLIRSGNVFLFEEGSTGVRRWTDGRRWSPSRALDGFLIYRELNNTPDGAKAKSLKPKKDGDEPKDPAEGLLSDDQRRRYVGSLYGTYDFKDGGLVKKAATMEFNNKTHHLVCYYTLEDALSGMLISPSGVPLLMNVRPRPGIKLTTKNPSNNNDASAELPQAPWAPQIPAYQQQAMVANGNGVNGLWPHQTLYPHAHQAAYPHHHHAHQAAYPHAHQAAYPHHPAQQVAYPLTHIHQPVYPPNHLATYSPINQDPYSPIGQAPYSPVSQAPYSPISPATYSPTHQAAYPPIHQANYPPIQQANYPPIQQANYPPIQQANYSPINQANYSPVNQANYSPVNQAIYSPINQATYLPTHHQASHPPSPMAPQTTMGYTPSMAAMAGMVPATATGFPPASVTMAPQSTGATIAPAALDIPFGNNGPYDGALDLSLLGLDGSFDDIFPGPGPGPGP